MTNIEDMSAIAAARAALLDAEEHLTIGSPNYLDRRIAIAKGWLDTPPPPPDQADFSPARRRDPGRRDLIKQQTWKRFVILMDGQREAVAVCDFEHLIGDGLFAWLRQRWVREALEEIVNAGKLQPYNRIKHRYPLVRHVYPGGGR